VKSELRNGLHWLAKPDHQRHLLCRMVKVSSWTRIIAERTRAVSRQRDRISLSIPRKPFEIVEDRDN
jgi:hypothetical protein